MSKLFIGNLDWAATSEDLKTLFEQYGAVKEAVIITDRMSGRSKGFGFVTYEDAADAANAVQNLNGYDLNGRKLVVSEARPQERR